MAYRDGFCAQAIGRHTGATLHRYTGGRRPMTSRHWPRAAQLWEGQASAKPALAAPHLGSPGPTSRQQSHIGGLSHGLRPHDLAPQALHGLGSTGFDVGASLELASATLPCHRTKEEAHEGNGRPTAGIRFPAAELHFPGGR